MSFKTRPNVTTTVKVVQAFVPTVSITSEALTKMRVYVDECNDEIGWLGTAYKSGGEFIIHDVFLFRQEVHATTTEITPQGLEEFATELLTKGDEGVEIWNNLKVWGHSHVRMSVFPSGQDDSQMETFKEGGQDWFIRLICNKNGELKLDLYNYETGVIYSDLKWFELMSVDEETIQNQIELLQLQLEELDENRIKKYEADIKAEMDDKVSQIKHTNSLKVVGAEKKTSTINQTTTMEKSGEIIVKNVTGSGSIEVNYDDEDILLSDDDVLGYFTLEQLIELNECTRLLELTDELELYGYRNFFSDYDIERIFRVMRRIVRDCDVK